MHAGRAFRLCLSVLFCWGLACTVSAQVGATFGLLETPTGSYRQATVMSATASTLTIRHSAGIAQIPLKSLSAEVQSRFGYDPEAQAAHERLVEAQLEAQRTAAQQRVKVEQEARRKRLAEGALNRVLEHFGTRPVVGSVDLRSDFNSLNLGAQHQGHRPSCAIFAVVGALEYERSKAIGQVEKLSEDYLIWATRQVSGRQTIKGQTDEQSALLTLFLDDLGFSLDEVLAALHAYGVPTAAEMPNGTGRRMSKIEKPGPDLIASAREHRRIVSEVLPGITPGACLDNVLHSLNEGVPVVVGFYWPSRVDASTGSILAQDRPTPYGHAVTLVGYSSDNGERDHIRFTFRNSWGQEWGENGYGSVELGYLERCLKSAAILEVRPVGR
jgi:hypothetical protein